MVNAPPIITCPQWGARRPRGRIKLVGRPAGSVFHHTAGHHPEISAPRDESLRELIRYALLLQADMIDRRGWIDSGHSFLVGRNGMILQGRWGTVTAIEHGRMVESAHCIGHNDWPGIEHEHVAGERLTAEQHEASVWLHAWIFDRCKVRPSQIFGHGQLFATECPSNLQQQLLAFRGDVARRLQQRGRGPGGRLGPLTRARFAAGSARLV